MVYAVQKVVHGKDIHLDQPVTHYGEGNALITISGWAKPSVKKIILRFERSSLHPDRDVSRPDVTTYLIGVGEQTDSDSHGFSIKAPLETFKAFALDEHGNETLQVTVNIVQRDPVTLGGFGWLFLNDSNSLREQAEGTVDVGPSIQLWDGYLEKFADLADEVGSKWCYCISPSKELVASEISPFKVSPKNALAQFLNTSAYRQKYICPVDELKMAATVSYWGGDTHWSSVGAAIASKAVLDHLGVPNDIDPYTGIEMKPDVGDLGAKLMGTYKALYPHLNYDQPYSVDFIAYKPGGNTGQMTIMHSGRDDVDGVLLVSGGSSFTYMERFIAPWFKTTYFIHGTGRMDPELMREIKPTHVLLQNNSRFMIIHPDNGEFCDVADLIDVKKLIGEKDSGVAAYDKAVTRLLAAEEAPAGR